MGRMSAPSQDHMRITTNSPQANTFVIERFNSGLGSSNVCARLSTMLVMMLSP